MTTTSGRRVSLGAHTNLRRDFAPIDPPQIGEHDRAIAAHAEELRALEEKIPELERTKVKRREP